MANLSNINNKFLFTDGDFLKIGNSAPINNVSSTESGISVINSNVASLSLTSTAATGKTYALMSEGPGGFRIRDIDANSDRLIINTSGNVGIGMTSPNKKLTVYGGNDNGIWIDSQGGQYTSLAFGHNGTEKANIAWDNTNGYTNISTYANGHFAMSTGGGIKAFLNSSGNFGIGTTSPAFRLEVISPTTNVVSRFTSQDNQAWISVRDDGYTTYGAMLGCDHDAGLEVILANNAATKRLVINNSGNVGIGTTSPTNGKFVINQNSSAASFGGNVCQLFENFNTTDGQMMSIGFRNNNSVGTTAYIDAVAYDQSIGATDIRFSTYSGSAWSSNMVTFQHTGRVGIGTSSPDKRLTVGGVDATEGINLKTKSGSNVWTIWSVEQYFSQEGYMRLFYDNVSKIQFRADGDSFFNGGNVGIGTTSPGYKLEVQGDTYINGRDFGKAINYASAQGWIAADPTGNQTAFYNGNFTPNGGSTENKVYWDYNYAGQRALIWRSQNNDAGSNADGGWNKMMDVASNNMGYMSVVYVKKNTSSDNGSFYHGCYGGNTLYLTGTANTNPYFHSFNVGTLPQDVWCISIGFIQANNDSNTANNPVGGVYRLDTGAKIFSASTFKMGTDSQIRQQHRAYLYYSTDVNQNLSFSDPGFYALDGSQPSISDLFGAGVPTPSSSSPFGQALKTYSGSANVTVATTVNASTVANLVSGHITITASTGNSIIVKTFGIYETSNMWFKDEASPELENANNDIVIACSGNATNTLTFTVGDPTPVAGYGMTVSIQASPPGFFNL